METWLLGPPLLVGEKIIYRHHGNYFPGTIRWMGRIQECFGNQMVAGVALVTILVTISVLDYFKNSSLDIF